MNSITPMLASPSQNLDLQTLVGTHAFDEKLDGIRCLATFDGTSWELRSRSGRSMTSSFPDVVAAFPTLYPCVLDGEIVSASGRFQDIAQRDKLTKPFVVANAVRSNPAIFMAFDALVLGGRDIRDEPWSERRDLLANIPGLRVTTVSDDPGYYEQVKAAGGEGVIAKRRSARYTAGRSTSWLKFKTVQSVSCVVTGYDAGHGARAYMGAITLAMLGPDSTIVAVGRAGSGFTQTTARAMKAQVDAVAASGDVFALPIVEIECLGVTRDGKLRQPIFKGVRSDLTLLDIPVAQLSLLNVT